MAETMKIQNKFQLGGTTYEFDVDSSPNTGEDKPVSSGGVAAALADLGLLNLSGASIAGEISTGDIKSLATANAVAAYVEKQCAKINTKSVVTSTLPPNVFSSSGAEGFPTVSGNVITYNAQKYTASRYRLYLDYKDGVYKRCFWDATSTLTYIDE